ncbi:MAG: crossover junction endodeoxyribonuclease RuvC [Candidatus Omnitrophica bacterium CG11_big_fil_rev_8_21_14_0_20_45_26]|uniref:Crossover junction endodeoxyribonuclease RuvC n=1 Tax=Candidatus Abzuiibacterium crystallinum TaxID=1974748 RepID=A0A2H0LNA0_9BACT|nr:MAG: crossover junction endodeoxyribonuclease RuvC [Candidatus Omnitrophica bacterium CG11_big_fil_rev_8_21_14_0_20_45_26]PIW63948.1 MAG: crossover junction endodeoxyribonuclease RuvC [Candidatus Omnitrophica bacterium CG12_big_fil_rev_8_21_14_0_65_45_16]
MRVAGIDPGTIRTGVAILEENGRGQYAVHHFEIIKAPSSRPLPERLRIIYSGLKELFTIYQPEIVALENVFFQKDFKAAVKIGEARAMAMLAAVEQSLAVEEYPPATIKQAVCGNGRAAKEQVQFMIKQILRLKEMPPSDAADALAVAICHFHMNGRASKKILSAVKLK